VRLSGVYLAMLTLAFAQIVEIVASALAESLSPRHIGA